MVGAQELFAGKLIHTGSKPLGQPAVVHEYQRGAVAADQFEELWVDRGPDGRASLVARPSDLSRRLVEVAGARAIHVVHGHNHLEVEFAGDASIGNADGPVAAKVARHLFERALRRREADALGWGHRERFEAFERNRE